MGQAQSGQGGFPGQGPPGGDKKDQVVNSTLKAIQNSFPDRYRK